MSVNRASHRSIEEGAEKTKSENGGSTNLSDGSNEVDEEFRQRPDEKFEFINEQTQDWPQWSVQNKEVSKSKLGSIDQKLEQVQQAADDLLNQDMEFMYSRGMPLSIRMKILESQTIEKIKSKKSSSILDKIKGWFKL